MSSNRAPSTRLASAATLVAVLALSTSGCGGSAHGAAAPTPESGYAITIGAREIVLASDDATARFDRQALQLTLEDAAGTYLTQTAAPPALVIDGTEQPISRIVTISPTPRGVALECEAGTSRLTWTVEFRDPRSLSSRIRPDAAVLPGERVITRWRAVPNEHFYGLTERIVDDRLTSEIAPQEVGHLDRRGETVEMYVTPTMALYSPFLMSSRGWGSFVEGTMIGHYDLAAADPDTVAIDFEVSPTTGEHDMTLFAGGIDSILDSYTALTGRPYLPPKWGFKHLRWRDEHRIGTPAMLDGTAMNSDFVDDITHYEQYGIPAGNYEFDRPWTAGTTDHGQQGFTSFRFDPERFPNSDAMLASLAKRGYHVFVFGAPWALGENATDATANHWYAPGSDTLIDYTNPDAVAWWKAKVETLVDMGISGMKLDRGEESIPDQQTDVWADGRTGREVKNDYPELYSKVHFDAFQEKLGADFVHYLRAGYAGSQALSIFWGGDSPGTSYFGGGKPTDLGLRAAILELAHSALLGFPIWGSDTGGYYEFGDREVFARWLAFSAFCPLMEIGGGGTHAPWEMPTDPFHDDQMIDIYRYYVTLHHELIPLFMSLAIDANASGRPIARPLVFDFPDDHAVADLWDELMLGPDLLMAPVWKTGTRSRSVYLPEGRWRSISSPTYVTGPGTFQIDTPFDRIPAFLREGGVLPLDVSSDVTGYGSAASAGRLTLDFFPPDSPSATSKRTLHDESGDVVFTASHCCGSTSSADLTIDGPPRDYIVRTASGPLAGAAVDPPDGDSFPRLATFADFEAAPRGFFDDQAHGWLWIKLSTHASHTMLRITDPG